MPGKLRRDQRKSRHMVLIYDNLTLWSMILVTNACFYMSSPSHPLIDLKSPFRNYFAAYRQQTCQLWDCLNMENKSTYSNIRTHPAQAEQLTSTFNEGILFINLPKALCKANLVLFQNKR